MAGDVTIKGVDHSVGQHTKKITKGNVETLQSELIKIQREVSIVVWRHLIIVKNKKYIETIVMIVPSTLCSRGLRSSEPRLIDSLTFS